HAFVGREARRRLAPRPLGIHGADAADQRADDALHQFVLDLEDLVGVAVEAIGPDMAAGLGVGQLRADADPPALPAHAALDDVADVELASQAAEVGRRAAVAERGRARAHGELAPAAEVGDDVLGDAVGEIG